MLHYIVWIDHDHAKAFPLVPADSGDTNGETHPISTHTHYIDHHTHQLDNLDREKRTQKMFQETAIFLNDAKDILIVGPGLAKHLFSTYLAEHFPKIFKKVAGCEALDHPTDPQIRAHGERFFKLKAPFAIV